MNNKEKQVLSQFPAGLDEAVNKKFGDKVQCKTTFDFFGSMSHTTNFKAKGKLKKDIELYIEAYLAGNKELAGRLSNV